MRQGRGLAAGLVGLLVLGALTLVSGVPEAEAAGGTSRAQADYALDTFGDPWDFENVEDFDLAAAGVSTLGITNARIEGGQLKGTATVEGRLGLALTFGETLPSGRDTLRYPIDASRYSVLSFRLTTDVAANSGVFWYTCSEAIPTCEGGNRVALQPGTRDYSVSLSGPQELGAQAWSGTIRHLRLGVAGNFELDWVRLHAPGTDPTLAQGPPGAPQPRILSPHRSGGTDYATSVRGDAWDFEQASDVGQVNQLNLTVGGGQVSATNLTNDGWFELPLAQPIDGSRFNRLTFTATYAGGFSLADACGGGMNARLVWQVVGQPATSFQDSQDIIVFPGRRTYDIELGTDPPSLASDETASPRLGWAGQQISYLRFDPHEDPCARSVQVEDIRIAETAGPGIRIVDAAFEPGTVVDIVADTDRHGCDGTTVLTDHPLTAGVNDIPWPGGVPAGTYWICAKVRDASYESILYSTGPMSTAGGGALPPTTPPTAPPAGRPAVSIRSFDNVCPPGEVPSAGFRDVGAAHMAAVDCVVQWRVARGYEVGVFRGSDPVNRSQMAAFLHRLVYASGGTLPDGGRSFPDVTGNPNEPAIRQLVAAGIVNGLADGTYGPGQSVSRAQMATFLVRTADWLGHDLPNGTDYFADDEGSPHQPNINAAAGAGLAAGNGGGFSPDDPVRREQMASFLARLLSLVEVTSQASDGP